MHTRECSDTGIGFYAALAQETGDPVLEIACGTGRVSIPIARMGLAVMGVDIVPGMLDLARHKSAGLPTRWVEGAPCSATLKLAIRRNSDIQ
jgi:ubiquinone/menaquinone biosynthesis C-methylase UbiE